MPLEFIAGQVAQSSFLGVIGGSICFLTDKISMICITKSELFPFVSYYLE